MSDDEEAETERGEDRQKAGCLADGLGCGAEGCLLGAIRASSILLALWLVS